MNNNKPEIKDKNFISTGNSITSGKIYEKPMTCPNCGYGTDSVVINHWTSNTSDGILLVVIHKCTSCDYIFHANYLWNKEENKYKFISIYPSFKDRKFDEYIENVSPRFIKLYHEASKAEFDGNLDLAGCGYRNAMEILIKDYAINCLGEEKKKVVKKHLDEAIEEFLPNYKYKNVADVVRILGNDTTHYEKKYEEIDFSVLKQYLDIFIEVIDVEIKMKNPPVKRNSSVKKEKLVNE